MSINYLIVSLRPRQWLKNLVLFAGILFSKNLFRLDMLSKTTLAFLLFSLLSGAVYLINDIKDRESDRAHPIKAKRPIAGGKLSIKNAAIAAFFLSSFSLITSFLLEPAFAIVAAAYFLMMVGYSFQLKDAFILDIIIISLGFVLRAVAGAVVIGVPFSSWLLICTIFLALFLALAKRRHEFLFLSEKASSHRGHLRSYSPALLDQMIGIAATCSIISYAVYTTSAETVEKFGDYLPLTIPLVLYGILRYLYLVYKKGLGGSPSQILISDKPLLIAIALWAVMVTVIVYFSRISGIIHQLLDKGV
jgi:4-hydroxybenzoate polyprenyltransferase